MRVAMDGGVRAAMGPVYRSIGSGESAKAGGSRKPLVPDWRVSGLPLVLAERLLRIFSGALPR